VLKDLIHLFKYKGKLLLSGVLCDKLLEFIKDNQEIIEGVDVITFVPASHSWLNGRDYNQSGLLAAAVSKRFGVPVKKPIEKIRKTPRQNELSREERLTNLSGAFGIKDGTALKDSKVLLVDDVMTTGATLSECAGILKSAGAKEVKCLTLARGSCAK
jgi:competence protein ComFC